MSTPRRDLPRHRGGAIAESATPSLLRSGLWKVSVSAVPKPVCWSEGDDAMVSARIATRISSNGRE